MQITADNHGHHALTSSRVRNTEHRAFAHARAFIEHALHHLRIDIEAIGDNQVVFSADQRQVTGVIDVAKIARIKPAVYERRTGGLGFVPVLAEKVGPANAHGADLFRRRYFAVVARDAHLNAIEWQSHRAVWPGTVQGQAGDDMGFGHAVA